MENVPSRSAIFTAVDASAPALATAVVEMTRKVKAANKCQFSLLGAFEEK